MTCISSPDAIEVRSVTAEYVERRGWFSYGRRIVVKGVSAEFSPGTITGIVGPNGSGKSTLLRAIVDPGGRSNGTVLQAGCPISQRRIAYVPQAPVRTLFPWLSAVYEIALPLRVRGWPEAAWRRRIYESPYRKHLRIPLDRAIRQLSGGQHVRVALLRALAVPDMSLAIFDEPFEGLDHSSRESFASIIEMLSAAGIPVVVTSHRVEDLTRLNARVLRLEGRPITNLVEITRAAEGSAISPGTTAEAASGEPVPMESQQPTQGNVSPLFDIVGVVLGLIAWLVLSLAVNNPALLPYPGDVISAALMLFTSELLPHLTATMGRALFSWMIANMLAIPMGLLLGCEPRIFRIVAPWLSLARCLPIFALVGPAIGLFPGYPDIQRLFLIGLTLFLISVQSISVTAALAPRERLTIARVYGGTLWFRFRHVLWLESLPGVLAGLEVTLPLAIVVTFVVEMFLIPSTGLGVYVFNHLLEKDLSILFAHILVPATCAAVGMMTVRRIGRTILAED